MMNSSATADVFPNQSILDRAALWAKHGLCFTLPLTCLGFGLTGPHTWYFAPLWLAPLVGCVVLDYMSKAERRQPAENLPAWPFDAVLFVLVTLQFINVGLAASVVAQAGFFSLDTLVAIILVGINSGYSAIVVGHELIHRESKVMQLLGRGLLCTVMYEHFYTEHVRGHHSRIGTEDDPATARFGETYREFWKRTVPAQFKSAWHLETKRIGDETMGLFDRRQLGNRVLHGLVAEWSLAFAVLAVFGVASFVFFLWQARIAIRALEAVNYFEHWGLRRTTRRVQPTDSWDTESAFTYYSLVGLSRHADHHAYAWRPYQQLRAWEESPKLPVGYFGMVEMVWFRNARVRELLTAELQRRQMGPFRVEVVGAGFSP